MASEKAGRIVRGRKPKPTNLKVIEGNRGKRALNKAEPKPTPVTPTCPAWLSGEARREWRRVVPELERLGLLTLVDRVALAGYCQGWSRLRQCEQIIDKEGLTYTTHSAQGGTMVRPRPEVSMGQKYLAQLRAFCVEFGLTPSSRGRMTVPEVADAAECSVCSMPVELCGGCG